jgi:AcrR family transcriptional regulator
MEEVVETHASPRTRLLNEVIAHFTARGLGEQSLRQIATAVGTSHRMLLYHFGSRQGLLLAVAEAVEERTRLQFDNVGANPDQGTDEMIRRMWEFFALYGRGLQGDVGARPLLEANIEGWLAANEAHAAPTGMPRDAARAHARLGLAVIRGLLLDLLATGDRAGVSAALDVFAGRYAGRWWEALSPTGVGVNASAS